MRVKEFIDILDAKFYTGVPDSLLSPLGDHLTREYGAVSDKHVIAANEGNAVGLAAGFYLSTGGIPVVYMQNSGEGNAVNPIASLLNDGVYGITVIFIIGWRGEPGVKDEPQHKFQGEITLELLKLLKIPYVIVDVNTTSEELAETRKKFQSTLDTGGQVAFVVRKGALESDGKTVYQNNYKLLREDAVRIITKAAGGDTIIATTGKIGRELFEIRENSGQGHESDFLTVGSMGHASSIALGIALQKKDRRVWCIDGDGAVLMHMGALAVIGKAKPKNFIHIVLNNEAHESVGGMPTAADSINLTEVARNCGYSFVQKVNEAGELKEALEEIVRRQELTLLEIKCAIGSRTDLGRPTTSPKENMKKFMAGIAMGSEYNFD